MGSGYNRGKHGRGNARGRRGPPAGPARAPEGTSASPTTDGRTPADTTRTTRSNAIPGENGQSGPRGQRQNGRGAGGSESSGTGRPNARRFPGEGASPRVQLLASQVAVATDGRAHPANPTTRETRETRDRHGLDGRENGRENGRETGNARQPGRGTPAITRPRADASLAPPGPNGHTPLGHHAQTTLRDTRIVETSTTSTTSTADASPAAASGGPGANGTTRTRGWRAVPPRPLRQPADRTHAQPRETREDSSADGRSPRPVSSPAPTRAGLEGVAVVPVRTPAPTAQTPNAATGQDRGQDRGQDSEDAEEYAQLTVPVRAVEPATSPVTRPEVRGEWGPLIDSLRDLFARDRTVASAGNSARCGLCYLHHPLGELEYREEEGYYVCVSCKQALGSARLPMVRRQQRAGR